MTTPLKKNQQKVNAKVNAKLSVTSPISLYAGSVCCKTAQEVQGTVVGLYSPETPVTNFVYLLEWDGHALHPSLH